MQVQKVLLMLMLMFWASLMLAACSGNQERSDKGATAQQGESKNCRMIPRTGSRTGIRVCDRN